MVSALVLERGLNLSSCKTVMRPCCECKWELTVVTKYDVSTERPTPNGTIAQPNALSTCDRRCKPFFLWQSMSERSPLKWRAVETPTLDALAPKFQESYKMNKDGHKVKAPSSLVPDSVASCPSSILASLNVFYLDHRVNSCNFGFLREVGSLCAPCVRRRSCCCL